MYQRTIWDFWAPMYERLWAQRFSLGPGRTLIHQHLEKLNLTAPKILDIGCGIGQLSFEIATHIPDAKIIAADSSLETNCTVISLFPKTEKKPQLFYNLSMKRSRHIGS